MRLDKMEVVSPRYRFTINQLAQAGGYELPADSLPTLQEAATAYFFPEDIIAAFLDGRHCDKPRTSEAIKEIARASIFQDAGVEAYTVHNAPLILGLTEIAAHATQDDPKVCYVLCSADVSNLAGLNRSTDRRTADRILSHLARIPEDKTRTWAAEHRYDMSLMPIRTGGDEFRYVIKLKSRQDIDFVALGFQLNNLAKTIHTEAENFSEKTGIDCIGHKKFRRAPGVGITVAFKPIDGQNPAIESMLDVMNDEITQARQLRDEEKHQQPKKQASNPIIKPKLLATLRPVPAYHPYAEMKSWNPRDTESLQSFAMRSALKHAGFDTLAEAEDVVTYDRIKRQTILNTASAAVMSLSSDERLTVRAVLSAESMRGLVDPITRCYSAAYRKDVANYYEAAQHRAKTLKLDATNLSGLNRISESFGDAMLREIVKILEHKYEEYLVNEDQKPAIIREIGGQFVVILPRTMPPQAINAFRDSVDKAIKVIGDLTISEFAKTHGSSVTIGQSNPNMLIKEIPPGREGTEPGIHIDYDPGNLNEQRKTQPARMA